MKVIMIECTAEELRANRTVMDSITEALSGFTRSLAGVDLDNAQVAEVLSKMNEEEEIKDEEEIGGCADEEQKHKMSDND